MPTPVEIIQAWRERLARAEGAAYRDALQEAAGDRVLCGALQEVMPELAHVWQRRIDRRRLLQLLGASLAMSGTAGCSRAPREKLVPYTAMPEGLVPGIPQTWATALSRGGSYAHGVLVKTHMGRPIKVEGNPRHPASRGASDAFSQAAPLELFDPERSRACTRRGAIVSSSAVLRALAAVRDRWSARAGRGLAVLTGSTSSPTLQRQVHALKSQLPEARWYVHEPIDRSSVIEGAALAFGRPAEPIYDFTRARVVVALDADFLDAMPGHLSYARAFADARRALDRHDSVNRLYAAQSTATLVGARADHRLSVKATQVNGLARRLAVLLGVIDDGMSSHDQEHERWLRLAAADLQAHQGEALVLCGDHQPAAVHVLVHAINEKLGNFGRTIRLIDPVADASRSNGDLRALCARMAGGAVDALFMLDVNPVYSAQADLPFAELLSRVPFALHNGLYQDETAGASEWHVPAQHAFETWSDVRAFDGSASIVQPVIAPLYPGWSLPQWLALIMKGEPGDAMGIVRGTWRALWAPARDRDFERRWHESLASGVVDKSQSASLTTALDRNWQAHVQRSVPSEGLELRFTADASVWDGRYANSAWLQELPRPLTSLTWGNALLISSALARELRVVNGDHVSVEHAGHELTAPVWIMPTDYPRHTLTLALGYGRTRAGEIGTDVGVNAYRLRTSAAPWLGTNVKVRAVEGHSALAAVQLHHEMHGRDLARQMTLDGFTAGARASHSEGNRLPSLYPEIDRHGRYAWGMTIDLNACIGCGVCTIACQAENNIPAVGKAQVLLGREMHWIRVDSNRVGDRGEETVFQPVPCMQCERAPCEYVCPVEASVHDSEGLNVQVYNRCIGTRDCSQNCPYKVRRFNWLDYNGYEREQPLAAPAAVMNPDVTVRSRGVMEKCTYCVQRISRARIQSKIEERAIREEEVIPACAAACPSHAIVFGDLLQSDQEIHRWRGSARHYVLLEELGTRPRTTYLAALRNSKPLDDETLES